MHFKTAAEIKAAKEFGGRNAKREEEQKRKAADRASQKYEQMRLEAEKREAARPSKPKLVIRPGVIIAPALLAANKEEVKPVEARPKPAVKPTAKSERSKQAMEPAAGAKQVWDATKKEWVKCS